MPTMSSINNAPRQIWHVGLIVDRLEDAMTELSGGLGLTWAPIHHVDTNMHSPEGDLYEVKTRVVFSLQQPLSIELIEPSPGTPNVRRGDSAFHHLGYWSDDLVAETERLDTHAWPCLAYRDDPDSGLRRIQLTEGPFGVILEACSTLTTRPGLEHFYPTGVRS